MTDGEPTHIERAGEKLQTMGGVELMTPEDIATITRALERRAQLLDNVHEMLWSRAKPSDITMVSGKPCFTLSFAKLTYRIVGGEYRLLRDKAGHPLVERKEYEDVHGSYYVYTAYGVLQAAVRQRRP